MGRFSKASFFLRNGESRCGYGMVTGPQRQGHDHGFKNEQSTVKLACYILKG